MQERPDDRLPHALTLSPNPAPVQWRPVGRLVFGDQPGAPAAVEFAQGWTAPADKAEAVPA